MMKTKEVERMAPWGRSASGDTKPLEWGCADTPTPLGRGPNGPGPHEFGGLGK
jgi:hypothetical protein